MVGLYPYFFSALHWLTSLLFMFESVNQSHKNPIDLLKPQWNSSWNQSWNHHRNHIMIILRLNLNINIKKSPLLRLTPPFGFWISGGEGCGGPGGCCTTPGRGHCPTAARHHWRPQAASCEVCGSIFGISTGFISWIYVDFWKNWRFHQKKNQHGRFDEPYK